MRTRIFILAALLSTTQTQAATEFGESIPTDVAKVLLGIEAFDGGLYTDIPADFPAFAMPQNITVIGSIDRPGGNESVYLRTNLGITEARDAVQQALQANGWRLLDYPGRRGTPGAGFVGNRISAFPAMLCHDEQGNLQITSRSSALGTVVMISRFNTRVDPGQTCNEMVAAQEQAGARRDFFIGNPLEAELPRLELPREGSSGLPGGATGGTSGSSNEIRASTPMQITWELPAILEHFATQVSAQGWTPQGQWNNAASAGGTWTRTSQTGAELIGILSIVRRATDDYLLEFRLLSTPRNGG